MILRGPPGCGPLIIGQYCPKLYIRSYINETARAFAALASGRREARPGFRNGARQESYEGRAWWPTLGHRAASDGPEDRNLARHFEAAWADARGDRGIDR